MANVGEIVAALTGLAEAERTEVFDRAQAVAVHANTIHKANEHPLVAKVEAAVAELFAAMREAAGAAVEQSADAKDATAQLANEYRETIDAPQLNEMTRNQARLGDDMSYEARTTLQYVDAEERQLLNTLGSSLAYLKHKGKDLGDAAVALERQSHGVVEMSAMQAQRLA